ncbi:TetR/AcrR family transcriptional regulator [Gordonia sp. CPCC 205333]|uniref:TetR/AcrR family transcriptional regulator n=1 Tax=Gordonia sp. CPCC 205333 TaxID=3140790 RepID=UPI003AF3E96C
MRRTQKERREATTAKLFDAAIATIAEVGYARTSANAIAGRAGMSSGALFRHFPTMATFLAAVAREAFERQSANFVERFEAHADVSHRTALERALTAWREITNLPEHCVSLELTMAARTDEVLRDRMLETMRDVGPVMFDITKRTVGEDLVLSDLDFGTLVFMVGDLFDAETLQHPLREPYPIISERRIPLLLEMLERYRASDD